MAIDTYAELKNRVVDYVVQSSQTVDPDVLDDLVEAMEDRVWAKLRVKEMRSYYTWAYAAGGADISDFDAGNLIEVTSTLVDINDSTRWPIQPADEETTRLWMSVTDVNTPRVQGFLSEADGTVKFAIAPEPSGKTVYTSYYRKFTSLTGGVNIVFTAYPHIWLFGLLSEVALYLRDLEMYHVWSQKFAEAIQLANERSRGISDAHKGRAPGPQHKIGRQVP